MTSATIIGQRRPVTGPLLLLLAGMGALLAGCQSPGRESPELARQRAEAAAEAPAVPDGQIDEQIHRLWKEKSPEMNSRLNVTVDRGEVLLTGNARDPDMRVDAVRLAWQADGVRKVLNEIKIADESSLSDSATDAWISTKLWAALLLDGQVRSSNYSIETVNQVVYIMGVARSGVELEAVLQHARELPRVRQVVNYVRR
ncbi:MULTISPECIES: BON domain-containing protein [Nitrospirillum]|uniref:Osmotically-inducible protein OsmY n=1 Tax=Nitrospirillum amazonense TaxID=28077 RepID=A0A560FRR0_9PROT|nr:BON domain-containing protein [Nitrospirillum amazonense]MEC4593720.1 BON domain-containing protein [Nitrospirillum amazonense]TWB24317.1 osmotically-inducible protein OsmY [Nitrospirillum amazonense]